MGFPLYRKSWLGRKSGTENLRLDSYQLSDLLDLSKMPHEFSFSGNTDFASSDDLDGTSDDDDIAGGDGDDDLMVGLVMTILMVEMATTH